jgi:transcriptional regulator with XRE-family HTH domain
MIAAALRQLRADSGKHLTEVAADLMFSTSKLSRLEIAGGKPQPRDIRDLIRYYGVEGTPLAASLIRWVNAAQHSGLFTESDDDVLDGVLDGSGPEGVMTGEQPAGTANTISGGTFYGPVIQGRDIQATTPSLAAQAPGPAAQAPGGQQVAGLRAG